MLALTEQHPTRYPRPVKRYQRNILEDQRIFEKILKKIHPILIYEANKIVKPYYIDAEDLVQEALIKIFKNKSLYNSNKGASLITWLIHVARKQFLNVAVTEFRKKRVPQNIDISKSFVNIDEVEVLDKFRPSINEYLPYTNQIEYELRYKEIIDRTEARLSKFAKQVFQTMIEPPESLIESIKKNIEKKKNEKKNGKQVKVPNRIMLTSQHLAEHFGVPRYKITQAKDTINDAMIKAFQD